jgi:hypothetical protein
MMTDVWLCSKCYKRCVLVEVEEFTDSNIGLKKCWICDAELGTRHITDIIAALWPLVSKVTQSEKVTDGESVILLLCRYISKLVIQMKNIEDRP